MSDDSQTVNITQVAHIFHHFLGILYLVGYRHVLKLTLTLSVTVEVETDAGNAMRLQSVADQLEHRTVLRTTETVTEHHHRTLLTVFQLRLLDDGCQLTVITVDAHAFTFLGRHIGTCGQLLQILVHLIG